MNQLGFIDIYFFGCTVMTARFKNANDLTNCPQVNGKHEHKINIDYKYVMNGGTIWCFKGHLKGRSIFVGWLAQVPSWMVTSLFSASSHRASLERLAAQRQKGVNRKAMPPRPLQRDAEESWWWTVIVLGTTVITRDWDL